jgi:hypothetical protein
MSHPDEPQGRAEDKSLKKFRQRAQEIIAKSIAGNLAACVGERQACQFEDNIADALAESAREAVRRAVVLADNPYSDDVGCCAGDEPLVVGKKIASVIRKEMP